MQKNSKYIVGNWLWLETHYQSNMFFFLLLNQICCYSNINFPFFVYSKWMHEEIKENWCIRSILQSKYISYLMNNWCIKFILQSRLEVAKRTVHPAYKSRAGQLRSAGSKLMLFNHILAFIYIYRGCIKWESFFYMRVRGAHFNL
jgi:hypothetical protein